MLQLRGRYLETGFPLHLQELARNVLAKHFRMKLERSQ